MLLKTTAINIKTVKYAESSLIVKLFTRSNGILSFYVKGVYSRKSAFKPAFFMPLQIIDIDFYYHENKNLLSLKEVKPDKSFNNIHFAKEKSPVALMMAELINKTVREVEKNETLFDFLIHCIEKLNNTHNKTNNFFVFFMVHLCKYLGFSPSNNYSNDFKLFDIRTGMFSSDEGESSFSLKPDESELLHQILNSGMSDFASLKIITDLRQRLIEKLMTYYEIHLEGFKGLNSLQVFRETYKNEINDTKLTSH